MLNKLFSVVLVALFSSVQAQVVEQPLKFAKSKLSAVNIRCVAKNDQHHYNIYAKAGQYLSTSITSKQDNAQLSMHYQLGGQTRAIEMSVKLQNKAWYGVLPPADKNHYVLVVSPQATKSCYELFVGISVNKKDTTTFKQDIATVEQLRQTIDANKANYRKQSKDFNQLSNEGGKATYYYEGQTLKLIELSLYFDSGQVHNRFYFNHQQLIFTYNEGHAYNALIRTPALDTSKTRISVNHYYYKNQQLIQWIDDDKRQLYSGYAFNQRATKIAQLLSILLQ